MIKLHPNQVRASVATMVLAASTLVGIAVNEGYRDKAYIPVPGDKPTIDFGRTEGVRMGDKSNPVRGLQYLLKEVDGVYAAAVRKHVKVPLHQSEFEVYVGWTYQFGEAKLVDSTMLAYLNENQYGLACGQLVRWVHAPGGTVYKGLVDRRIKDYQECVKDHTPEDSPAI